MKSLKSCLVRTVSKGWLAWAVAMLVALVPGYASASVTWTCTTLDSVANSSFGEGTGYEDAIALDSQGDPHISFFAHNKLHYARRAGGVWSNEVPDSTSLGAAYTSIALDSQGDPHISYFDYPNLKYVHRSAGIWRAEKVDSSGNAGLYSSIDLDSMGSPRIAYRDNDSHELRYAARSGGVWAVETVPGTGDAFWITLALDSQDRPHIGFSSTIANYAFKSGATWTVESFDAASAATSLALDAQDRPSIAYFGAPHHLKFASRSTGNWVIETVADMGAFGRTTIEMYGGEPRIIYYHPYENSCRYAFKIGGVWTNAIIDQPGGNFPALALDAAGNPRVSHNYGVGIESKLRYCEGTIMGPAPPPFLLEWGANGSGSGQFIHPRAIATDGAGNVYVADTDNHRIQKFSSSGAFVMQWGSVGSGAGQFSLPYGVAVDGSDNLYIADTDNQRIQKFTSTGTYLTSWGSPGSGNGQFFNPRALATNAAGDVYVADTDNHRIQMFSSTGAFIRQWGSLGSGPGQFIYPFGVAADAVGDVYVSDRHNHRIQKFDLSGIYVTEWGSQGGGDGQFNYPFDVTTDVAGNVYVADEGNHRIQKFTNTGDYLTKWGSLGSGSGQFFNPEGVTTDAGGNIYVADTDNHRIQKFGQPLLDVTPAGSNVIELRFRPNAPNPFRRMTTFAFELAAATRVSLEVYSVTGQRLATVIPGQEYRAGLHRASFDGACLPTGMYFYRYRAGNQARSGRMVLIK